MLLTASPVRLFLGQSHCAGWETSSGRTGQWWQPMNLADTSKAVLKRPRPAGSDMAMLVHIYPPGPDLGRCYPLTHGTCVIGRDEDSSIPIHHPSVSRRHACIEGDADGYFVADLQSTNGTFINDAPVDSCLLKDGDYLRVGNCIYRFLTSSNAEAKYHEEIYR